MKLGFRNLAEARARAEFPASHPRFKSLTDIQIKAQGHTDFGPGMVSVRNTGLFALHDVTFRIRYIGTPAGKQMKAREYVTEIGLQSLAPGQAYVLFTEVSPKTQRAVADGKSITRWVDGVLSVSAPGQGKVETPITGR